MNHPWPDIRRALRSLGPWDEILRGLPWTEVDREFVRRIEG